MSARRKRYLNGIKARFTCRHTPRVCYAKRERERGSYSPTCTSVSEHRHVKWLIQLTKDKALLASGMDTKLKEYMCIC